MSSIDTAIVRVTFEDGEVTIGAEGEFFIQPTEGESFQFDSTRYDLISRLIVAQHAAEVDAE